MQYLLYVLTALLSHLYILVILFYFRCVTVAVPVNHMHFVSIGMLSIIYEVYQCILVELKWLQERKICSVTIIRLRQKSLTTSPVFLVFHVSAGYGIQQFFHIVNVTEKMLYTISSRHVEYEKYRRGA